MECGDIKTTNIVTKLLFYSLTAQISWNMHTCNINQFTVELVQQRQELKNFFEYKLVPFKYELLLTIIFLWDELFLLRFFQSELNLDDRGIENAEEILKLSEMFVEYV